MASIREIKVTYGASSLLYGENAVAGVIEISTEPVQPGRSAAVDLDIRRGIQRLAGGHVSLGTERVSVLVSGNSAVDQSSDTTRDTLPYRPRHRVTVDTRWTLPAQWRARAALYHTAGIVFYSRRTPLIRAEASSHQLADVSLTRALSDA